jgi:NADH-quinone oxidoreductase subunit H
MEALFINLAEAFTGWMIRLGLNPAWAESILLLVKWIIVITIITVNIIILIWLERKISAFFQERLGPNRLGPFGIFQTVADAIKLLTKEDIVPSAADKLIFKTAPMFFIVVAVMLYTVIPMGKDMEVINLNIGLLFFISVGSLSTIALLMAGWGSNNKWSLMGAVRSVISF